MEDLLFRFVGAYHEHNYSDIKPDREDAKERFEIVVFKFMWRVMEEEFVRTEEKDYQRLNEVLEGLNEVGNARREEMQLLYDLDEESRRESA